MNNISSLLLIFHVIIAILIVALILIQKGKGADMGSAFGAGASGTIFGAKGSANFLSRTTAVFATIFFLTSLALAYVNKGTVQKTESVLDQVQTAIPDIPDNSK
jgi:preprotein translocase subunit SecG|tara:strand:- start:302 stop:613 length:312 start_codon:yes stop_codon:yes gene_type:complete